MVAYMTDSIDNTVYNTGRTKCQNQGHFTTPFAKLVLDPEGLKRVTSKAKQVN